jgi:hypothetical protein
MQFEEWRLAASTFSYRNEKVKKAKRLSIVRIESGAFYKPASLTSRKRTSSQMKHQKVQIDGLPSALWRETAALRIDFFQRR